MKEQLTKQDTGLIKRIKLGDKEAEAEFFALHDIPRKVKVMVFGRSQGIAPEEKKDLISDILFSIVMNLRKGYFDPQRGSLNAYIWGIVRNKVYTFRRENSQRAKTLSINDRNSFYSSDKEEDLLDLKDVISAALQQLDIKYKQIIYRRYYLEQSVDEIAMLLHLSRKQVYNQLGYAITLMRKFINRSNF